MMKNRDLIALVFVVAAGGCAPSAPSKPTWVDDVQPMLMANCVRCHGSPASGGAPSTFRLDRYEDSLVNGQLLRGAKTMARAICARVSSMEDMPPNGSAIPARARDIFERWVSTEAACKSGLSIAELTRGTRANNAAPEISINIATADHDRRLEIDYLVTDADHESVLTTLALGGGVAFDPACKVLELGPIDIGSGAGRVSFDTTPLCEGIYSLSARLDDGEQVVSKPLGKITVTHPGGNLAPRVELVSPARDSILNAKAADIVVEFTVLDGDNDYPATFKVTAVRGDERIELAQPGASVGTDGQITAVALNQQVVLSPAALAAVGFPAGTADNWRFEVSVTDKEGATTTVISPYVIVSDLDPASLDGLTFHQDSAQGLPKIKDLLSGCNDCHGTGIEPDGVKVDVATYLGLTRRPGAAMESRLALLYRKVVQKKEMPPPSTLYLLSSSPEVILPDAARGVLASWLLAGAPEGIAPP